MPRRRQRERAALPTWLAGAAVTLLLAIFGYLLKLGADVACARTEINALNRQMHDVAEMVGELWRAK